MAKKIIKADICYRDRYGKLVWEKIGWASEGYTAAMASQVRSERLRAVRYGEELSRDEAQRLLEECAKCSLKLHDIVLLSLQTGMRAGEIINLRWGDVLPDQGLLHILDSKNGRSRQALLTEDLKKMFARRDRGVANEFVFVSQRCTKTRSVSGSYDKAVAALGFNDGVEDRRQKVVFRALRHTFGSWLAMSGAHPRVIMDWAIAVLSRPCATRISHRIRNAMP